MQYVLRLVLQGAIMESCEARRVREARGHDSVGGDMRCRTSQGERLYVGDEVKITTHVEPGQHHGYGIVVRLRPGKRSETPSVVVEDVAGRRVLVSAIDVEIEAPSPTRDEQRDADLWIATKLAM